MAKGKNNKMADDLMKMLKKHFFSDDTDMFEEDKEDYGDTEEDMEFENGETPFDDESGSDEFEYDNEENKGKKLPKDKRKNMAILVITKKLGKVLPKNKK